MYFLPKSKMNVISRNETNNFATNLLKILLFWAKTAALLIRCSPVLFLAHQLYWHNLPTQNKHTIRRCTENISFFQLTSFCYDTDCYSSSFRFNNVPHLITYQQRGTMFTHQRCNRLNTLQRVCFLTYACKRRTESNDMHRTDDFECLYG